MIKFHLELKIYVIRNITIQLQKIGIFIFDTKVIVSNDVLEKREFNFMLKGDSREEGDSGWSILSGYESDDYVNDPKTFKLFQLSHIEYR